MIHYLYDSTFEGLLTAIYEAYYRNENPECIYAKDKYQQDFCIKSVFIETDNIKAKKVYNSIKPKIGDQALKNVYHLFLSEDLKLGTYIYNYLRLGWKMGKDVDSFLQNDLIRETMELCKKVTFENHRMTGLLRFKELDNGVYYASYEPDYNITGLLAMHFKDRLTDQKWAIHDIRREKCAVYQNGNWVMIDLSADIKVTSSMMEQNFQKLWKRYYNTIAIKERINSKLQRQMMPMRYWHHLTEITME